MRVGDYEYALVDGDCTVPTLTGKPRKIYPVVSDSSVFVQEEDYRILIDYYVPLAPSARHETETNLFYIKDTPIRDIGNGVGAYTRTWASLPGYDANGKKTSYVSQDWESFVMTVPGITSTDQTTVAYNISGMVVSGDNHVITTADAHDIQVDDGTAISYYVQDPITNLIYYRNAWRLALAGTGGTTVVVKRIKDINTVLGLTVCRATSNQEPYQKTVASRIDMDYWLPGVSVDTALDIPIIQEFFIIAGDTGNRTEYLSTTSNPTLAEYRTWVEDGRWIVAEPSVLRKWQNSEIIERTTRYVRATL